MGRNRPTALLENLICSFSVKHINQPGAAAWMRHLVNEEICISNKKPLERRGINMQEGTGQTITTLMTYPVGVLRTLTLRKNGIKRKGFKTLTERTKIDAGSEPQGVNHCGPTELSEAMAIYT